MDCSSAVDTKVSKCQDIQALSFTCCILPKNAVSFVQLYHILSSVVSHCVLKPYFLYICIAFTNVFYFKHRLFKDREELLILDHHAHLSWLLLSWFDTS